MCVGFVLAVYKCQSYSHILYHANGQCEMFHIFTSYKTTGDSDLEYLFYDACREKLLTC